MEGFRLILYLDQDRRQNRVRVVDRWINEMDDDIDRVLLSKVFILTTLIDLIIEHVHVRNVQVRI